uniref:Uncharacterized protein n=1 Tax=Siphoviridae sp. ctDXu9 TaxID=2825387 RepID=A0A8S5VCU3_9CAUD|nr:MAG TPA: hypothetical protein [Siphoviridae sp. ctDXu9]DAZ11021.1 MAG TPA: hypothetical protein [Caudoviricetes sp.]
MKHYLKRSVHRCQCDNKLQSYSTSESEVK